MTKARPFSDFAMQALKQRYLREGEDWDALAKRVVDAVYTEQFLEKEQAITKNQIEALIRDRKFIPNSPTLMNAGSKPFQPSACFVLEVEDSVDSIFDTLRDAAKIFQSGGGVGLNFSNLRPEGSPVGDQKGVASGPISFAKVFNEMTEQMKQGGRRKGALMGMLDITHPDIVKFIKAKDDLKELNNFNISVAMNNRFMKDIQGNAADVSVFETVFEGEVYYIRKSDDRPVKKEGFLTEDCLMTYYSIEDVWNLIVSQAHKNGEPGVVFLERIREINGWDVISTNPCSEIPLADGEACVLGSIDLGRFVTEDFYGEPKVNYTALSEAIRLAVIFLNRTIDSADYPLEKITKAVKKSRKIGLGPMGWADMLMKLGIKYDSEEARALARNLAKFMTNQANKWSVKLGYNNKEVTTCAPTGSISTFAGCSSGIEPLFAAYIKQHRPDIGTYAAVHYPLKELLGLEESVSDSKIAEQIENGSLLLPEYVQLANEVSVDGHVRMQAAWQEHITNSISKTINMPEEATVEDVAQAYLLAWNLGCKGITVYRDGSRKGQPLSDASKEKKTEDSCIQEPKHLDVKERPRVVQGKVFREKIELGDENESNLSNVYISVGLSDEDNPMEIFVNGNIRNSKELMSQYIDAVTRLLSLALRSGVPLEEVVDQLEKIEGTMAFSLPVKMAKILAEFIDDTEQSASSKKLKCPDCEADVVFTEGCRRCTACSWSACGGWMKSRLGEWNKHTFILSYDDDPALYKTESRVLWLTMIKHAKYEYIAYKYSADPKERALHFNAKSFLFDDNYTFDLNSKRITTRELCDLIEVDLDSLRKAIREEEEKENKDKEFKKGTQYSIFDI